MRLAVLDLGSNTFHLLLAAVDSNGSIAKLGSVKRTLKLGAEIPVGGVIDDSQWKRAMSAIEEILTVGRPFESRTLGVATSVFREAANGRAFIDAVRVRFGVPVELLTGTEEARLSYLGAISDLPSLHGPVAVIDVGGGSVQLTAGEGDRCLLAKSLPFGVLRLCQQAASTTADAQTAARTIAASLRLEAKSMTDAIAALEPRTVVFASGTARAIASLPLLDTYEPVPPPRRLDAHAQSAGMATRVTRTGLRGLGAALLGLDAPALSALGVPADRHATAGPGAIVLETLMDLLRVEEATIATRALREGVIVRTLSAARDSRPAPPAEAAPLY
jgi:exopolyphosphatase/guanosine-5'-triphosphate,3'-diphosphate pyrophosphatase